MFVGFEMLNSNSQNLLTYTAMVFNAPMIRASVIGKANCYK